MVYGDFKDLPRKTASDKVLCNNNAKNSKYDGCKRGFASTVFNFLIKNILVLILLPRAHSQRF